MKPLDPNFNLAERVYQAILDEILDGHLRPGQHLIQEQMAASLGVSRQPVQQAMTRLKADGAVEATGRRGLRVAAIDIDRVSHNYELRGVLDGYAARVTAQAVLDNTLDVGDLAQRMKAILSASENAIADRAGAAELIRHDVAFHKTIYAFSGNPVLGQIAEPIWRFVRRAMARVLDRAKPAEAVLKEHRAILNAILKGDHDLAEQLAQAHATDTANQLKAVYTEDPENNGG